MLSFGIMYFIIASSSYVSTNPGTALERVIIKSELAGPSPNQAGKTQLQTSITQSKNCEKEYRGMMEDCP